VIEDAMPRKAGAAALLQRFAARVGPSHRGAPAIWLPTIVKSRLYSGGRNLGQVRDGN